MQGRGRVGGAGGRVARKHVVVYSRLLPFCDAAPTNATLVDSAGKSRTFTVRWALDWAGGAASSSCCGLPSLRRRMVHLTALLIPACTAA